MEDHLLFKMERTYSLKELLTNSYKRKRRLVVVVRVVRSDEKDAVEFADSPDITLVLVRTIKTHLSMRTLMKNRYFSFIVVEL